MNTKPDLHPAAARYVRALADIRRIPELSDRLLLLAALTGPLQVHELASGGTTLIGGTLRTRRVTSTTGSDTWRRPASHALVTCLGADGELRRTLRISDEAGARGSVNRVLIDHEAFHDIETPEALWVVAVTGLLAAAKRPEERTGLMTYLGYTAPGCVDVRAATALIDQCCRWAGFDLPTC